VIGPENGTERDCGWEGCIPADDVAGRGAEIAIIGEGPGSEELPGACGGTAEFCEG
jgi:hypothetical protein